MRSAALRKPAFEQIYVSAEIIVLVRGVHYNLDLELLYVDLYGLPRDGSRIRFVLAPGAQLLSRRADLPACRTGYFGGATWQ